MSGVCWVEGNLQNHIALYGFDMGCFHYVCGCTCTYVHMSCELSSKLNSSVEKNSKHPRSHCTSFSSHHDGAAEAESGRGVNKNADQSRNLQFMDRMNGY